MESLDTNVSFNTSHNEHRTAFDIISTSKFGMLNGLSIPSGICLYKDKKRERSVPEMSSETMTSKCIPEGLYSKLFNLACYKIDRTRKFKKSKSNKRIGSKNTNKKKFRHA